MVGSQEKTIRLSIITPVYNGASYLARCLESVASQAGEGVEHVVVDGGSTDGTVEILASYSARFPGLRWVSEPDRGQSHAMNKGIIGANGTIIGVLNADDYYEPGALSYVESQFSSLVEPTILVGNCNVWNNDYSLWFVSRPSVLDLNNLLMERFIEALPMNSSAYFYHRSLHDSIGFYDENDHFSMDVDFLLRAVSGARVVYIDQILGNYWYRAGSKTYNEDLSGATTKRLKYLIALYRRRQPLGIRLFVALGGYYFRLRNRFCSAGSINMGVL